MNEPAEARPRVLMLSPYFLPAEQGGGSVRAVLHLVRQLHSCCEFVVAARNHDLRSTAPFSDREMAATREACRLDIRYLAPGLAGACSLHRLLKEPFDLIYMHSLMAPDLSLLPLLLMRLRGASTAPLLVAPRGELMPGALMQRARAKHIYLRLLRITGLLRNAHFHATCPQEADAIIATIGQAASISIAADLPPTDERASLIDPGLTRQPGPLRVLFLSRIDAVKNLGFALDVLAGADCAMSLDIVGPIGNDGVWADCLTRMSRLPSHVQARYLGAVPHAEVAELFARHDLLFLPTLGENNGFVIHEALLAGCPVLLSDRTPWRGLEAAGVGADLSLEDMPAFVRALKTHAGMPDEQRQVQRARCRAYALERLRDDTALAATCKMLDRVIQPKARICSTRSGHSGD